MPKPLSRRDFLKSTAATGLCAPRSNAVSPSPFPSDVTFAPPSTAPAARLPIKKGVLLDMLPKDLSYAARLKMARDAGFEVIQAPTIPDQHEADEIKRAAETAGIRIDSVMNKAHWQYPLSSSDPEVVRKSLDGMKTSLHNA